MTNKDDKSRQTVPVLDRFQKARREFVQTVAEQASRPENIFHLMDLGVLALLRPLLMDEVAPIKHTAALALGRLANYKESIAVLVTKADLLPEIVTGLQSGDNYFQRHACFVIHGVAKHSAELADTCVQIGVLDPLVACLSSSDNKVVEASASALGCIGMHSDEFAQAVVDANAIPYLIKAIKDPEMSVKRISIATLGNLAKHTPQLAQSVIDAQAISRIAPLMSSADARLQQQVVCTLSHIAKHSIDAAELVVEAGIFPRGLDCLKNPDQPLTRKWSAALVRATVQHTRELAQLVINVGGAEALASYINPDSGNDPYHGLMAVGFIASFSQKLAQSLFAQKIDEIVLHLFLTCPNENSREAAAWALGQLGKHAPQQAAALAAGKALESLLATYTNRETLLELWLKAKSALKLIVAQMPEVAPLLPLLATAPEPILHRILAQIANLLAANPDARPAFAAAGGIDTVARLRSGAGAKAADAITRIIACYPEPEEPAPPVAEPEATPEPVAEQAEPPAEIAQAPPTDLV
jgi:HEAT repeat protein